MPKPTKEQLEAIEREAMRLYDEYNPEPNKIIHVSKHECLRQAKAKLLKPHT